MNYDWSLQEMHKLDIQSEDWNRKRIWGYVGIYYE